MSQPVKLSDVLVLDARLTGRIAERSIAGQIEYWANLGRAIEPLLQGHQALALCKRAGTRPLSECLSMSDTVRGRRRLGKYLETLPYPHYEPVANKPGLLVRIDESGRRTVGRFINRQFRPGAPKKT
ncbi:MAG: TA system antitoxin ParD family protein [Limisphaerales bacterium]